MSTVFIPDYLVNKYSLPPEYQCQEDTVEKTLKTLSNQYPAIISFLYEENGNIRKFINIFLDGDDIRSLAGMQTSVGKTSKIMIIIAVAGG